MPPMTRENGDVRYRFDENTLKPRNGGVDAGRRAVVFPIPHRFGPRRYSPSGRERPVWRSWANEGPKGLEWGLSSFYSYTLLVWRRQLEGWARGRGPGGDLWDRLRDPQAQLFARNCRPYATTHGQRTCHHSRICPWCWARRAENIYWRLRWAVDPAGKRHPTLFDEDGEAIYDCWLLQWVRQRPFGDFELEELAGFLNGWAKKEARRCAKAGHAAVAINRLAPVVPAAASDWGAVTGALVIMLRGQRPPVRPRAALREGEYTFEDGTKVVAAKTPLLYLQRLQDRVVDVARYPAGMLRRDKAGETARMLNAIDDGELTLPRMFVSYGAARRRKEPASG